MNKPSSTNRTGATTVPNLTSAQSKPPNGTPKMTLAEIRKEIEHCKLVLTQKNKDIELQRAQNEELKKENKTLTEKIETMKLKLQQEATSATDDPELDQLRQIEIAMRLRKEDERR